MVKVGIISKWHVHAEGYAQNVNESGVAKVTAVWDDDEARGKEFAEQLGCDYYSDLDAMLETVDAVVNTSETTKHFELLKKAVNAGKAVFTEKVVAPTVEECEKLADLIEEKGITFTVSLPQLSSGVTRFAKEMIDRGDFGKITAARIRNGHDGVSGGWLPEYWFDVDAAAGGSLLDLGCHPMYTANYLFGKAKRISSLMTAPFGSKVDEAATAIIEFENGVICDAETSFDTYATPGSLEIYGSDATLISVGRDVKVFSRKFEETLGTKGPFVPKIPESLPIPLIIFLHAVADGTGTPENLGPRAGVELTRLLENSYVSERENRIVEL